jgi:hypothetical protein
LSEISKKVSIALLNQEGSGIAKQIPRGVVPKPKFIGSGNHPLHDLDFVSILLPS